MTQTPTIAILGATGGVARHLPGILAGAGLTRLRFGARDPRRLALAPAAAEVTVERVDAADEASLSAFCRGASVVVNCVGPVRHTRCAVVRAALAAGARYVDSAAIRADDPVLRQCAAHPGRVLFAAGAAPGVSELLVRWLADHLAGAAVAVTGYAAVMDVMTAGAAEDFLHSLDEARGGAGILRRGHLPPAAGPVVQHHTPFFPEDLVAYPFLSADAAAVADMLGVTEMSWYNVFDPASPVLAVLAGHQSRRGERADLSTAARGLRTVANAWLGRQPPFQQFVVEMTGSGADGPSRQVAVLRAGSTYRLTAAALAVTVAEISADRTAHGQHLAALALDPATISKIVELAGDARLWTLTGPLADYATAETGSV